jgi:hypothetical protein
MPAMKYRCHVCEKEHDDLPDIGATYPDPWFAIPEAERGRRVKVNSDLCEIDGESFFIRGVIQIPLTDDPGEHFAFGAWVSQAPHNFHTYVDHYDDAAGIGPFFGWLCTRIAYYDIDTTHLKTRAHFRPGKLRPLVELEPTDHPLAVDQRCGMTLAKAWEIVHFYSKS